MKIYMKWKIEDIFKYKILIYLKSGKVMRFKCKDCIVRRDDKNINIAEIRLIKPNVKDYAINYDQVAAVVAKQWWRL